ncbi:MAG TPA: xanthine dehydrogenase accessory protein XdhC [Rubrivivax sp.]
MNSAIRGGAFRWLAGGVPAVVVEVIEARGSVPREAGTRMVVSREEVLGTIGGGHLELKAIAFARDRLNDQEPAEQHFALGPALGQCCGGAVTLRHAPLSADALAAWPVPTPRFTLQLYGAGHVGRAIVDVLAQIDCRVQWIDERESEFPQHTIHPPHIERVCVEPVEAEVAMAPPGAYYLVLTHSHDLDLAITEAVLRRGDFGFLGLIGSQTKRVRFLRRFEERGITPTTLARMTCPIGLPGITGKEPPVIAVAVVAQLLARSGSMKPGTDGSAPGV